MAKTKVVSWEEWAKWVNKQLEEHQQKIERLWFALEHGITPHIYELEHKIRPLIVEYIEPTVLELLRSQDKPRRWDYFAGRLGREAQDALQSLVKKGLATTIRSGNNTMYVAKES